jgi:hypothetical protein
VGNSPSDSGLPHSHETHEIEIGIGCAHETKRWGARAEGAIAEEARSQRPEARSRMSEVALLRARLRRVRRCRRDRMSERA